MSPTSTELLAAASPMPLARYPELRGTEPCHTPAADPEDWFGRADDDAIRACYSCPRQLDCLAYALDHPTETQFGVWAGTTAARRNALRRFYTDPHTTTITESDVEQP